VTDFSASLQDLIKERRSVRFFNGNKISKEDILSIIEAGTWAPTGCNNQELRFLILDEKKQIDEIIKFKPFLKGVSTVILIFCDMSLPMSPVMYRKNNAQQHLVYIDNGLALANMILYAKSKFIDSCVLNLSEHHFKMLNSKKTITKKIIKKIMVNLGFHKSLKDNFAFYVRNQLKIPNNFRIIGGVAFGYAKKYPDVQTAKHVHKKILRQNVNHYIIQQGS